MGRIRRTEFWLSVEIGTLSKTAKKETKIIEVPEHTVEIITNSGEGAQKCAQIFGQTCAKHSMTGIAAGDRESIA